MHNAAFADHMKRWGQLAGGVAEDASDAAILQPKQESLIQARAEAWEAKQRQLHHRAAAQQATRDLEAAMARAQEAATRLQYGLQGRFGVTSPQLVAFGVRPRRAAKARARAKALEALAELAGGAPPHHAGEPAIHAAAAQSAGGNSPRAGADSAWTGGDVPQAEADVATLARTAQAGGGKVPQAAVEAATGGGTAPPAVEAAPIGIGEAVQPGSASLPTVRIIPVWMRVSPVQEVALETPERNASGAGGSVSNWVRSAATAALTPGGAGGTLSKCRNQSTLELRSAAPEAFTVERAEL